MTPEEKIHIIAELDGFEWFTDALGHRIHCKPYLTSYDAIIPLIQKQSFDVRDKFAQVLIYETKTEQDGLYSETPEQLCDALIKAFGKWKDN